MYHYQKLTSNLNYREVSSFSNIPHLHNEIEIVYINEGYTELFVDEKTYKLGPNSFSCVFPNQIHKYNDNLNTVTGYMLHCPLNILKGLSNKIDGMLPTVYVLDLTSEQISLLDEIQNDFLKSGAEIITEANQDNILNLISGLIDSLEVQRNPEVDLTTTQMILNYCFNNFKEPLTLDQLAKELSINKFYISHIFNSKLSISFTDYLAQLRVEEAKKQLCCSNTSITNIAYDVGFSTIRSFNRRFREFCKIAPKEYRQTFSSNIKSTR